MDNSQYPLALPQGTILSGQYIIEKVLGQGGFGITYQALDHKTGKKVAVKEYFPDTLATRLDKTTVMPFTGERGESFTYGKSCFLQEAETLSQFIGNENIIRIYVYFEENGTAYFVMDFIEGTSLDDYIRQNGGSISYDEAERLLKPVFDALSAVHSKGIIHRDIAPDNIYITNDGKIMLLDFGAARYSLGDRSRSLDVVLKHGFAPREQYTRHGRQGPFTDVYALGATFYFAITGRRPPDSIDRIDDDMLLVPSSLGVKISPEKEDAILHALSVNPADRYQSVSEFKQALLGVVKHSDTVTERNLRTEQIVSDAGISQGMDQVPAILKRMRLFLEDGEWDKADEYCEKVLDIQPENAMAYVGKLMVEMKARTPDDLAGRQGLTSSRYYQKALRFAEGELRAQLEGYAIKHDSIGAAAENHRFAERDKTTGSFNDENRKAIVFVAAAVTAFVAAAALAIGSAAVLVFVVSNSKGRSNNTAQTATAENKWIVQNDSQENVATEENVYDSKAGIEESNVTDATEITDSWDGDYVVFGSYEQDGNLFNGPEPIEWEVINDSDGKMLLISRYILDCQPYNTEETDVTWETCTLRNWLNNEFYNTAFSSEEQGKILTANLSNPDNAKYGKEGGNDTQDKVFCLSVEELLKYYTFEEWDDEDQYGYCNSIMTEMSGYARSKGGWVADNNCGNWWLRSPGGVSGYACVVSSRGGAGGFCGKVGYSDYGVRPAIYIIEQ